MFTKLYGCSCGMFPANNQHLIWIPAGSSSPFKGPISFHRSAVAFLFVDPALIMTKQKWLPSFMWLLFYDQRLRQITSCIRQLTPTAEESSLIVEQFSSTCHLLTSTQSIDLPLLLPNGDPSQENNRFDRLELRVVKAIRPCQGY